MKCATTTTIFDLPTKSSQSYVSVIKSVTELNLINMKNIPLLLLSFLFLLQACGQEDPMDTAVLIRIKNTSASDFENIHVNTSGGQNNYGNLAAGETSAYMEFASAYRYAYVRLEVNGQTALVQPFDYVGETLLENGKYTYELSTNGTSSFLDLEFKED